MKRPISHAFGDRAGVIVATLCFVHCVAGPALIAFGSFSSLIAFSERTEILFMLASATIGTAVLFPGYRRRHRRRSCLAMFGSGMAALLAHRYAHSGLAELATALVGASLIAGAHILNHRYSRRCDCCETASEIQAVEAVRKRPEAEITR
jgi:MerC mercury resistance protein